MPTISVNVGDDFTIVFGGSTLTAQVTSFSAPPSAPTSIRADFSFANNSQLIAVLLEDF